MCCGCSAPRGRGGNGEVPLSSSYNKTMTSNNVMSSRTDWSIKVATQMLMSKLHEIPRNLCGRSGKVLGNSACLEVSRGRVVL